MSIVTCPSCGQTIEVQDKKTGMWWGIGCLIAAVAIPVILAVVGLLAAIAIPSFVKARETSQLNACINNMRIIDSAKEQAAMMYDYRDGDTVPEAQLSEYITGGLDTMVCPAGGDYTINPVGVDPECSVHGSLFAPGPPR